LLQRSLKDRIYDGSSSQRIPLGIEVFASVNPDVWLQPFPNLKALGLAWQNVGVHVCNKANTLLKLAFILNKVYSSINGLPRTKTTGR
jgi:hypothetical protein